jgi:hypothetical protein
MILKGKVNLEKQLITTLFNSPASGRYYMATFRMATNLD